MSLTNGKRKTENGKAVVPGGPSQRKPENRKRGTEIETGKRITDVVNERKTEKGKRKTESGKRKADVVNENADFFSPSPPLSVGGGVRSLDVVVTSPRAYPLGYKRQSVEFGELCAKIGALRDSSRGCGGDKSTRP